MSLCDRCLDPGHCCRAFSLNGGTFANGLTALEVLAELASVNEPNSPTFGLPMMPLVRWPNGIWDLWCPNLGRNGRCMDYENRPRLCRIFEPLFDNLCIMSLTQDPDMDTDWGPAFPIESTKAEEPKPEELSA